MKNLLRKGLGAASLLVALTAMAVFFGQSARVLAADDDAAGGRIVEISPDQGGDGLPNGNEVDESRPAAAPKYWIGLQGLPINSAALRTQLQLADDVGVLVENVVPGSPAQKAGLRQHDVIIAVNGDPINDLAALQKVVADGAKKPIELKVIRLAQETKVAVTPKERPADAELGLPADGRLNLGGPMGDIDALLRQFQQQGGAQGGPRVFGPRMILGGQAFNLNQMPADVSVSVARQDEGPAEITVKKGDETWTLKSDDEEAIEKLPEDIRPFVQQLLEGTRPDQRGVGAMHFDLGDLQKMLPDQLGGLAEGAKADREALRDRARAARKRTERASERLLERMEEMEARIQELQEQLQENRTAPRTNDDDDPSKS